MYRCVRITHPDEYLQCILWRENPEDEVKVYTLDTVTYGTKSAAFLAIRSMQQLSQDEEANFPLAAKVVRRDFYVDDLISGGDTVEEVTEIRMQVKELLRRGHFPIRKWCSNEPAALEGESEDDRERLLKFHDGTDIAKTLGLVWDPSSDDLIFHFSEELPERPATKRAILSAIAKFYDPLGLIAPIITKLKIFLQELWKYKLDWDESLPLAQHSSWLEHKSRISAATSFKFPRFVLLPHASWEIHGFCDASMSAYGACIYIRSESKGELTSRLLCSKSRVAPLKTLTIPKLELAAAHLLSELISNIAEIVQLSCSFYCWSDSTIVLSWIREAPSNFNVFVSNRIAQIQERTKGMTWRHVPSEMNPADVLSRGCTTLELLGSSLWCEGPVFLRSKASDWPATAPFVGDLPERRRKALVLVHQLDITFTCKYQNSFGKLQRVFAYIHRFMQLKHRDLPRERGVLTVDDIRSGTHLLVKAIQLVHFADEHKALSAKKPISNKSRLTSLNPLLDHTGLMRVVDHCNQNKIHACAHRCQPTKFVFANYRFQIAQRVSQNSDPSAGACGCSYICGTWRAHGSGCAKCCQGRTHSQSSCVLLRVLLRLVSTLPPCANRCCGFRVPRLSVPRSVLCVGA
ncbi:hypothetical protein ACLKA6_009755 [Drosophila palustris]